MDLADSLYITLCILWAFSQDGLCCRGQRCGQMARLSACKVALPQRSNDPTSRCLTPFSTTLEVNTSTCRSFCSDGGMQSNRLSLPVSSANCTTPPKWL
jgi:hypothetical protein